MTSGDRGGFSLIEAMVALIIASLCLIAAFELQQAFVRGEERAERALLLSNLQADAATLLAEINPSLRPSGEVPMAAGRRLRWSSSPLTGARQQQGYPSGASRFEVRLYRVQGDILDSGGRLIGRVAFDRMGWRAGVAAAPRPNGAPPAAAAAPLQPPAG